MALTERVEILKSTYNERIGDLMKQSKLMDIFYNHNSTKYKVDKAIVTSQMEQLLDVVNDLEALLFLNVVNDLEKLPK